MSVNDLRSGGVGKYGISVNSNQLTTDIDSITSTHRLGLGQPAAGNYQEVTCLRRLIPGDVVRAHGSGAQDDTSSNAHFHIIRISE